MAEWLTYAEGSARYGCSQEALRQRATRFKWRRRLRDDGRALVLIPDTEPVRIQSTLRFPAPTEPTVAPELDPALVAKLKLVRSCVLKAADGVDYSTDAYSHLITAEKLLNELLPEIIEVGDRVRRKDAPTGLIGVVVAIANGDVCAEYNGSLHVRHVSELERAP
jgi:hypothetical protein